MRRVLAASIPVAAPILLGAGCARERLRTDTGDEGALRLVLRGALVGGGERAVGVVVPAGTANVSLEEEPEMESSSPPGTSTRPASPPAPTSPSSPARAG